MPFGSRNGLRGAVVGILCVFGVLLGPDALYAEDDAPQFVRGDANLDGSVTLSDVYTILRYMSQGRPLACADAADADDSGHVSQIDVFYILGALFYRHKPPPAPFPYPGTDGSADVLGCRSGLPVAVLEALQPGEKAQQMAWPLPELPGDESTDCEDDQGGADIDFLHFRGEFLAQPGDRNLRVPVHLTTAGEIEAITLSFYADPAVLELEDLDFSATYLESWGIEPDWTHVFRQKRDEGYLAGTMALSIGDDIVTMPGVRNGIVGHLKFSVRPDVPLGSRVKVLFRTTPGDNGVLPIRNEISRQGYAQSEFLCGFSLEVVEGHDIFVRGDANRDRSVNIGDVIAVLRYLFLPVSAEVIVPCPDAADADDSGVVQVTDAILIASFLFGRGPAPVFPFPLPGRDWSQDDALGCVE